MDRKAPCLGRGNLIAGVISVPSRNTVGFGIPELGPMPCTNSRAPFWAEFPPRAVQSYPPPPPQQCHTPPPPLWPRATPGSGRLAWGPLGRCQPPGTCLLFASLPPPPGPCPLPSRRISQGLGGGPPCKKANHHPKEYGGDSTEGGGTAFTVQLRKDPGEAGNTEKRKKSERLCKKEQI